MKNELIITSELINAIITKSFDEYKTVVQDNLESIKSLQEPNDMYVISKVINSAVYANLKADVINKYVKYLTDELGYVGDIETLITKKLAIKENEAIDTIIEQCAALIDICTVDVNDILLGSEIEKLLNFLINDYEHILENVFKIESYTQRLKAIQR